MELHFWHDKLATIYSSTDTAHSSNNGETERQIQRQRWTDGSTNWRTHRQTERQML